MWPVRQADLLTRAGCLPCHLTLQLLTTVQIVFLLTLHLTAPLLLLLLQIPPTASQAGQSARAQQ